MYRLMFPVPRFQITGIEPDAELTVLLEFVQFDEYRYKFNQTQWLPVENSPCLSQSNAPNRYCIEGIYF
jgi:hypothetical protein